MTYLKLEISGRRLQNRAEEEWRKIEYFNPVKSKHDEGDDWVEFDGDDYFTQLQFYIDCCNNLATVKHILYSYPEVNAAVILYNEENSKLEKLNKAVENTRNHLKSTNENYIPRIDFTKLLEIRDNQRKLVAELDDKCTSLKISTNVEVPKELDEFLTKYGN